MRTLEELRDIFHADRFATEAGMVIESAGEDGVRCGVEIGARHLNAAGCVQGGVVFTLADFAFAVAANRESMDTVTLDSTVHYLRPATGGRLAATARCEHSSRTILLYRIEVVDETGKAVASVTTTGYRRG